MTNNTQIRTKRISFILALLVIAYVAVDTYLFTYHQINTTTITTPVIIGLVVTKLLQKSGIRKNEVIELIYRGFI